MPCFMGFLKFALTFIHPLWSSHLKDFE